MNHFFVLEAVSLCLLLLSTAVRPSPWRWVFWPLLIGFNYAYYFFRVSNNDGSLSGSDITSLISTVFAASDYILLTNVQSELRVVGQKEPISSLGIWDRLKWGLHLLSSVRGVGWVHEPRSVLPPHPTLGRIQFVISRLGWLIGYALLYDVVNPLFMNNISLFDEQLGCGVIWRAWGVFLFAISAQITISIPHLVLSIISVGSGLSKPGMWPHLFGQWSEAYTIRRFWGRTWHQCLRRTLSSHGKYLAQRVFRCPVGSLLSSYIQLYAAFLISGVIHNPAYDSRPIWFFLSQPMAITFEDAVIALVTSAGLKPSRGVCRGIGYLWVYGWFVFSAPPWVHSLLSADGLDGGMKHSFILDLYRRVWHSARG